LQQAFAASSSTSLFACVRYATAAASKRSSNVERAFAGDEIGHTQQMADENAVNVR
jgi:hypothetical protein